MIKIGLTDSEVEICSMIGQIRHLKTSAQCAEQIQSNLDPVQISIDGVLSEYIVAKHKGLFLDLNCEVRKFGADLISNGKKIDIKSTRKEGGDLNIRITHKDKDYDFYVLVELTQNDNGIIVGYISRDNAIKDENIVVNPNGNPYYKISRNQLKPLK